MKPEPPSADGKAIGKDGAGGRHDLEPGGLDQPAPRTGHDGRRRDQPADHAAAESVADLFDDYSRRMCVTDAAGVGFGNGERDEEQRHANAVVEPAFDVEPLADPRG